MVVVKCTPCQGQINLELSVFWTVRFSLNPHLRQQDLDQTRTLDIKILKPFVLDTEFLILDTLTGYDAEFDPQSAWQMFHVFTLGGRWARLARSADRLRVPLQWFSGVGQGACPQACSSLPAGP